MKSPVHFFESLLIDMRVDLRGRNVRMPQHLLDHPEIGSVIQQVGRKRMPQQMRMHFAGIESRHRCPLLYYLPHSHRREPSAIPGEENVAGGARLHQLRPRMIQVSLQSLARAAAHGCEPRFVPLPCLANPALFKTQVFQLRIY